jgi:hydroxyacylglutathione hydrolase
MIWRLLYNHQLAQASYLVGCAATGEALVVDLTRDLEQYLELAEREGLRISAVTETHIHGFCREVVG